MLMTRKSQGLYQEVFAAMMMMMRRFIKRVLNSPQRRCQSIKQVALEMSGERQRRERCGSKGSWQTGNKETCPVVQKFIQDTV